MTTQLQRAKRENIAALSQQESALISAEETTIEDIKNARDILFRAYDLLGTTIAEGREAGSFTWEEIAEAVGMSRQTAANRFRHYRPTDSDVSLRDLVLSLNSM